MIKRACWEARHSPEGRDIPKFAFGHLFSFKFPTKVHHKSWTCYGFRKLSFPSHLFRSLASSNLCLERCSFILFSLFLTISYRFLPWSHFVLQTKKSVSPNKSLWGLNLWCKDLVPQKKNEKDMQWVCWLFRPPGCLYVLNREWTSYKRWVTKSWSPTKVSVPPNKSLP